MFVNLEWCGTTFKFNLQVCHSALYWNGVETKHHGVVRYAKNGPAKYVPSKAFDKYGLK